jgi:hypothetical protein
MEALWKTAKIFRIVGVQAGIRTEHFPKTNQEYWPKLNRPSVLKVAVSVYSAVTEQVASFGKTCDLH